MKKYQLEVTEEQAGILVRALDLYSRIAMGQFTEITGPEFDWKNQAETKDIVDKMLDAAKRTLTDLHCNSYYRISVVEDRFRIAYDLQQVIRHRLAWDRDPKKDVMNLHKDEPLRYGSHPLAVIRGIE